MFSNLSVYFEKSIDIFSKIVVTDCSRLPSPSHLLYISRCLSDRFFTSKYAENHFLTLPDGFLPLTSLLSHELNQQSVQNPLCPSV